jgi:hypothetical protein
MARSILAFVLGSVLWSDTAVAQQPTRVGRVLGVYDYATGLPIPGVSVVDVSTGEVASTTETGTVSLAHIDRAFALLLVRKLGFVAQTVAVNLTPVDTVPVTVLLSRSAQVLPEVRTEASADTIRKLIEVGFYERRQRGAAPSSAYVTAQQLDSWNLTRLSDLVTRVGRAPCGDIYVNGVKLTPPQLLGRSAKSGADGVVQPAEVAGIEFYSASEAPTRYLGSSARPTANRCAVTLIWLK